MTNISMPELLELNSSVKIIDIRDKYQYNLGNIPNSINIPMNFLLMNPENYINKNEVCYIYCGYGNKSKITCNKLIEKGYNVVNVLDGYNGYLLYLHKK